MHAISQFVEIIYQNIILDNNTNTNGKIVFTNRINYRCPTFRVRTESKHSMTPGSLFKIQ